MVEKTPTKSKLKPRGAAAAVHEKMARLDVLAHKVIRFWERTLDEKSNATTGERIQVARDVVSYAWGKPKQQVQVDAKVEVNHKAHVDALTYLALAANGPIVEHNPLETMGELHNVAIQPLLPHEPHDTIVSVEISSPAALDASDRRLDDPPPGALGTPAGARAHGHPHPLVIKNDE